MEPDVFWALIEKSAKGRPDVEDRSEWLTGKLSELPVEDIADFDFRLATERVHVDTWAMWGAAWLICGGTCSDDSFWYFQAWLVGLGRETFRRVAADPDALADVPQIRELAGSTPDDWDDDEWPDWESLDYVAEEAFDEVAGEDDDLDDMLDERGDTGLSSPEPTDERWDFEDEAERRRRYPRLSELFPIAPAGSRWIDN